MIRRSPGSRLLPLVALVVLSALALPLADARLATSPAGGTPSAGGTK